jgi:uncharacterized iron-regulated membrane protein
MASRHHPIALWRMTPRQARKVWLLELGDGWAIAMIVTGLYLCWPRGQGLLKALWPRLHAGPRIQVRDLHACIAVGIVTGSGASGGSDSSRHGSVRHRGLH